MERTTRALIKTYLRQLFYKSKEHHAALKRDGYCCQMCHRKKSQAKVIDDATQVRKVQVHHLNGINWDTIIDEIMKEIVCDPALLQTLCKDCHLQAEGKGIKK